MENAIVRKNREVLCEIKEEFDKVIQSSRSKTTVCELMDNPLWMEIGKALYNIPPVRPVNRDELIRVMADYIAANDIGYLQLNENLQILKDKGYIRDLGGSENYFLTKEFARAVEIATAFKKEVIDSVVETLKQCPEYQGIKGLDKLIAHQICNAIK